jgi:hypothetical protein
VPGRVSKLEMLDDPLDVQPQISGRHEVIHDAAKPGGGDHSSQRPPLAW